MSACAFVMRKVSGTPISDMLERNPPLDAPNRCVSNAVVGADGSLRAWINADRADLFRR